MPSGTDGAAPIPHFGHPTPSFWTASSHKPHETNRPHKPHCFSPAPAEQNPDATGALRYFGDSLNTMLLRFSNNILDIPDTVVQNVFRCSALALRDRFRSPVLHQPHFGHPTPTLWIVVEHDAFSHKGTKTQSRFDSGEFGHRLSITVSGFNIWHNL